MMPNHPSPQGWTGKLVGFLNVFLRSGQTPAELKHDFSHGSIGFIGCAFKSIRSLRQFESYFSNIKDIIYLTKSDLVSNESHTDIIELLLDAKTPFVDLVDCYNFAKQLSLGIDQLREIDNTTFEDGDLKLKVELYVNDPIKFRCKQGDAFDILLNYNDHTHSQLRQAQRYLREGSINSLFSSFNESQRQDYLIQTGYYDGSSDGDD
jgi:hypothetical protein